MLWMFKEQNVLVYVPSGPKITLQVAKVMCDVGDPYTTELMVATGKKIHVIFDWSAIENYENEARNQLLSWGRARSWGINSRV
jgi:hypothetical protein